MQRVVEPDLAKILGYNRETILANHMELLKFCTASDIGYGRVLNRFDNGLSSKAELTRIFFQLPMELGGEYGFYKRMILSLSTKYQEGLYQQDRGRRIFYWVTFPKRPISVAELQDVLAIPSPSQEMDLSSYNFHDNRPLELDRGILSACGGLVEVGIASFQSLDICADQFACRCETHL